MDWIEQWFGVNPDGGDGSLEKLLIVGLVVFVVALGASLNTGVRRWVRRVLAARQS